MPAKIRLFINNSYRINVYQGSTLTVVRLPGASEMRLRASETAPNLSDRASENDSVICSIPEE
jgi:hypothetical protein